MTADAAEQLGARLARRTVEELPDTPLALLSAALFDAAQRLRYTCTACKQREQRGPGTLMCGGCYARLCGDLAAAAGAYTWLDVAMGKSPSGKWGPRTRNAAVEAPIPLDVDALDLRERIAATLRSWANAQGEEYEPPIAGPADTSVLTVAAWLRDRLAWASSREWCADYAAELHALATAAHGLAPWAPWRRDLPMDCPACGYLSLTLYAGHDAITCRNRECGHVITWAAYEAYVRDRAAIQTALGRMDEGAAA